MTLSPSLETEKGYSLGWASWTGYPWDLSEPNSELQWPFNIRIFDEMRRSDGQLGAVRRAIRLPLLGARWRLDPNGARPEVVRLVAEDLAVAVLGSKDDFHAPRLKDRFTWRRHLEQALLALDYGHMAFEQVYAIVDGQARLRNLAPRMPMSFAKILITPQGHLTGIEQYPQGTPGGSGDLIPISRDRLVWYCNELEGGNWQGVSIHRNAYKHWLLKDRLLRVDAMKHERNGMGIPVYEGAPGSSKGDLAAGQDLANKYRATESAGAAVPHGAALHLVGVQGQLPDTLASIRYHDEAMARAVLAQFLDLGTTKTGSRALGDSFIDFFKLALDAYATIIAESATQDIIEDLVDLNWGSDEPAPRLVAESVDVETELPPDAIVALVTSGVVTSDDGLENYIRDRFNLPSLSGPVRAAPTVTVPKLPNSPELASRGRTVRAARAATLRGGSLQGAFATMYDRRQAMEAKHRGALAPAMTKLAATVDVPGIVDATLTGRTVAASANPSDPVDIAAATSAANQALQAVRDSKAGQYLELVGSDAIYDAAAEGSASAAALVDLADGGIGFDWDIEFRTMLAALEKTGTFGGAVDTWVAAHLDGQAAAIGKELAQVIADGGSRTDMEAAVAAALDDMSVAGPLLDHAIAQAMGVGSQDYYAEQGVASVDFLTAGDALVDSECDDAENNGPYAPAVCPLPPLHFNCRCCLAPSDEAIRQLASGSSDG